MNILMVVTDLFFPDYSGGARRTLETTRILTKLGHNITILCNKRPEDSSYEKYEDFEVYRVHMLEIGENARKMLHIVSKIIKKILPKKDTEKSSNYVFESHLDRTSPKSIRAKLKEFYRHKLPIHKIVKWIPAIFHILTLIRKKKIDIVYERGPSYGVGILSAKLSGRLSILDFIDIMYWNWALKNCSRILSYFSTYQIPEFIDRSKIDLVYTCADVHRFNPNVPDTKLSEKPFTKLGIYIGGFYHWHGLQFLVEAVAYLKINHPKWLEDNDFGIQLIGRGEFYESIRELIQDKGVVELFHLHDKIDFDEVPLYLKYADFCISLNTGDALGMKVFEYMSMGKPILISNIDNVPKFLSEDVVYLVDPTNIKEIAQQIMHIINNPEKSNRKGTKARELAVQKYSWEQHGRNIEKSIIEIIQSRKQILT